MATKVSSFKANYKQDPRIEFKERRKGKYKVVGKFVKRIQKIQEEAKVALRKAQDKMKKFVNRKWSKGEKYKVGDLVLLSTKDLKWQMKERWSENLTECFVESYRIKEIVSSNVVKLELLSSIKIYPIVNISWVYLYKPQVEGQQKVLPKPVIIEGEEEFKVEKILNKRYIVEKDTWESKENLENTKELVKEFKKEYGKETKEV